MTVRGETARKRVPREAYLVSRMRRYRDTLSVLRFTLHERRVTRKTSGSAVAVEAFVNYAGRDIGITNRMVMERGVPHED